MFTQSAFKDIGIGKFEFVAKTQVLWKFWSPSSSAPREEICKKIIFSKTNFELIK